MKKDDEIIIHTNKYQTPVTRAFLEEMSPESQADFLEFATSIPFIKWMISPDRPRCCDLPRDSQGRAIIDITRPPILEDMDYFRPSAKFFEENGCYTFLKPNPRPGSEYRRWFEEEVRRCREGYVRESDGQWITGYNYFYLNYGWMKIVSTDPVTGISAQVESLPKFWEGIYLRYHYHLQARLRGEHCAELAKRGASKAHPYDHVVYTPDGKKKWGDVKVGDVLFGDDGKTTRVIAIPFDDFADVYKITLRDGRTIEASSDHLWKVSVHNKPEVVMSTLELLKKYKKKRKVSDRNLNGVEYDLGILRNEGVEWEEKPVPVDPYTFGLLLGDGCFRHKTLANNAAYTCPDDDFDIIKNNIPYEYKKLSLSNNCSYFLRIPRFIDILKNYGLYMKKSEDKFIPDDYKYNSRRIRLELIKGLFDSDGYSAKGKRITIVSKLLADDILFVLRSLGINCSYTVQKAGYKKDGKYIKCNDAYCIIIHTDEIISKLPRKISFQNSSLYAHSHEKQTRIVNIEYVGKKMSKCVTVDNESHCYLIGDFVKTHNSYCLASDMTHNLLLGENEFSKTAVNSILTAATKEYLAEKDGTLNKFVIMKDFCALNTEFPRLLSRNSPSEMLWKAGYIDKNGNAHGSNNIVMGVSIADDEGKVRGKRGQIYFEEMGNFPRLKEVYNNVRDSVKDGDVTFAQLQLVGTSGDKDSDFAGAKEILYHPDKYDIYSLPNVYDLPGKGTDKFAYFFPAYISRTGCMDKDGNSDVTLSLKKILMDRDKAGKKGDATRLRVTAERPITPSEAMMRVKDNYFPVIALTERLRQLESDPRANDDVYIGELVDVNGELVLKATDDVPLRQWRPMPENKRGALEIWEMPVKGRGGEVMKGRYVIAVDPVDNDNAESESLFSCFVFDMFTDRLVAEFTGRRPFAEDNYEIAYNLTRFYNGICMMESNKKGMYAYFAKRRSVWMLADCPEYLRERQLVKYSMFGSGIKGVSVNGAINNLALEQIKDWLNKMVPVKVREKNSETNMMEEREVEMPMLYTIRSVSLLQELISYTNENNTDRVSALAQAMLYREQFIILYGGAHDETDEEPDVSDDEFFNKGWNVYKSHNRVEKINP